MTQKTVDFRRVAIVLLLQWCLVCCASAETISLATGEWKPYTSKNMEGYGVFSQIVTAVFNEAGIDARYRFFPWKRCEAYIRSGRFFAAFPFSVTDERSAYAYFSDPVSESMTVFFYNNSKYEDPIEYSALHELSHYSIVGVLGYFYTERFQREKLNVTLVSTETKALELIFLKKHDLLPLNNFVGWRLINENFPDDRHSFSTCQKPLSTNTLHLMVSRRYPNSRVLIERFNAALSRIREKGIYRKIVSTHLPAVQNSE